MYSVRYNPVFHRWVLVGPQEPPVTHEIRDAQLLQAGSGERFVAAHHPHQPFVFDPIEGELETGAHQTVYASEAPVGEYELLLDRGGSEIFAWGVEDWKGWFELAQQRVRQLHTNPHLHHVHILMNTAWRDTLPPYRRVGELIATSQEFADMSVLLTDEIAQKLHERERMLELHHDAMVHVLLPSAPLHGREVWLVPNRHHPSLESVGMDEKVAIATILTSLFGHLHNEFPEAQWVMRVHTGLATHAPHLCWWIQLYEATGTERLPAPVHRLPELFFKELQHLLHLG